MDSVLTVRQLVSMDKFDFYLWLRVRDNIEDTK